jgi:site-specific DNA-methyltransferase (adenine-specific)
MIDSLIDNVEQEQQPNSEQIADITMSNPAIGNTTVSSSIVYNMDCVEGMKHYPDKYFDLAVVDPPYVMLGNTFRIKNKKFTNGFVSSAMDKGKDAKIEFGLRPTIEYFSELYRVSKNQIIWGMQYFVEYLLPHQCVLIWDKGNGTNRFSDAEIAATSFDTAVRIVNKWMQPCGRIHPTQKPIDLYDWIFNEFTQKGQRILDTHLGSGSSRISADKAGLEFVGFEIDKKYYELSEKRFKNYKQQLRIEGF